jgi:homoserine kinase type II
MAVYTEVGDEELLSFVAHYPIGDVLSCKGIAEGIENSNYLLTTTEGSFILTLYEKRVKAENLPFFLGLMEHLAAKGVPCPTPIRAADGEALGRLCGRPAAIVSFLAGMWPRRITPEHCLALGEALAEMHVAGADYGPSRANDLSVEGWRPLLQAIGDGVRALGPGAGPELDRDLGELERGWPANLPVGVIHADLFPDNVFFRAGRLSGLIDFYFACRDALAYDIAVCLNAWCFEADGSLNVTKARRLVQAYRRVRDLTAEERRALPTLARGAAMRFLLTRLFDWVNTPKDALVTRKDPSEYLAKLRFHRGARSPADYGLD